MKFERKTLDRQPGPVPEIRVVGDSVIFLLDVPTQRAQLVIRCNPDGSVDSSIDFGQGDSQP